MAPAPTSRTEVAATAVGETIFVVGGVEKPALSNIKDLAITDKVEAYDTTSDRWTSKAPLPLGLHHVGIATIGDRVYVVGGFKPSLLSVWKPVASLYIYDGKKDRWTEGPAMPTVRGALAVAVVNGKLYAIGGFDGEGNTGTVEEYDPGTNTWTPRAPLPTARDHLAAAAVNGQIYTIGGRLNRDYHHNLGVVEVYDPASDQWARRADLPTPRSGITAGVIDEVIYVAGGESPGGTFGTNEAYDPAHDRWQTMAPMPTARHGLGSAVVRRRWYVINGGPTPGGSFSQANEVFDPPTPRTDHRSSGRATPTQVGTIMALLATFQDADVLPPQSSPEADRLVKALIQFQAALMRSRHPAVQQLLRDALRAKLREAAGSAADRFAAEGWTSESLEAVIDYAETTHVWERQDVQEAFGAYNVGKNDFDLLAQTFYNAKRALSAAGQDVHARYAVRRREMPGAF